MVRRVFRSMVVVALLVVADWSVFSAPATVGVGQAAWYPAYPHSPQHTLNTATYVMDASGELTAVVFRVPKAGTIDKFGAFIAAVGNAPDNGLRFSFQDVALASGQPDGVVDQFATVASGSVATGWLDPGAFNANRTVTRNELLSAVLDFPTFVAADSVTAQSVVVGNAGFFAGFPYGISVTNTKTATSLPQIYVHYTDGTWLPVTSWVVPFSSTTTASIDTGTTPDEVGMAFTLPYAVTLDTLIASLNMTAAGSDFDVVLYDAASSVLATWSHDGDVSQVTASVRTFELYVASAQTISANTLYRLVIKPTTLNNIGLGYGVVPAALFDDAVPGAGSLYMTQRTDAGAWTDFNNGTDGYRIPSIFLGFSHLDDGASGGGRFVGGEN